MRTFDELLNKRGAIYISRQNMPMGADIVSGGKRLLFLPNNDLFKLQRKIAHEVLGPGQKNVFAPHQDLESRALLYEYLVRPEDWWLAHARYSSSVIMNVVFGRRTKLGDENVINILTMGEKVFEVMQPGSNLVDAFPFLAKVPLPKWMQPWRWTGDKYYKKTLEYIPLSSSSLSLLLFLILFLLLFCINKSLRRVVNHIANGRNYAKEFELLAERQRNDQATPCAMSEIMRLNKHNGLHRDSLYFLGGTLMEAGSDTTRVSLNQIAAAATLFPDWVERARKQLDEVCGANAERLPTADDAPMLPLIKGAAKETIRWK